VQAGRGSWREEAAVRAVFQARCGRYGGGLEAAWRRSFVAPLQKGPSRRTWCRDDAGDLGTGV
jgi:hypothetical protein